LSNIFSKSFTKFDRSLLLGIIVLTRD
jgi:hypothetical protein